MAQIQFSLIKENKDWRSRTLTNPHPLRPITSAHSCLTVSPPIPLKVDVMRLSPLTWNTRGLFVGQKYLEQMTIIRFIYD